MKKITLLLCSCFFAAALQAQVVIHVPADYPTIQLGIDAANPGDTVLVSDGTYTEQINFLGKKPLMVASEFILDGDTSHISNTIIDGSQITNPDSATVVYFISAEDSTSVLCGFTITGGRGTYLLFPDLEAGGILVWNCGAKIRDNIITANALDDSDFPESIGVYGGAAACYSYDQFGTYTENWIVFENNEISDNSVTTGHLYAYGGGLVCLGNIILRNNTIEGNSCILTSDNTGAWVGGGGLLCVGESYPVSEVIFSNNRITGNTLEAGNASITGGIGAGALFPYVKLNCTENEFTGNKIMDPSIWGGGGMLCEALADGSRISGNIFRNNESSYYGGGMFFGWTFGWPVVENNYFFDNSAWFGGGICFWHNKVILQNNVYCHNTAETAGGALYIKAENVSNQPSACFINNTFTENSAHFGGAIDSHLANLIILNSIFWNDTANYGPEIQGNNPFIDIAYCNIDTSLVFNQNNEIFFGEGIINEDPMFTDEWFNISIESPCIDGGIDEVISHDHTWEAPAYDIAGNPRPQSGGFEIGAYEVMFVGIPDKSAVGSQQSAVGCYPNPTRGMVDFRILVLRAKPEGTIFDFRFVSLRLYDIHGKEVALIYEGNVTKGDHTVRFDASAMPAGIYFYRLTANPSSFLLGTGSNRPTANGKLVKY